jgi:hypothetical protein
MPQYAHHSDRSNRDITNTSIYLSNFLVCNKYEGHVLEITLRGENLHNFQITAWRFYNSVHYKKKICLEGYNTLSSNADFAETEYNILYNSLPWLHTKRMVIKPNSIILSTNLGNLHS